MTHTTIRRCRRSVVLRARDPWPRTANVCCHRPGAWSCAARPAVDLRARPGASSSSSPRSGGDLADGPDHRQAGPGVAVAGFERKSLPDLCKVLVGGRLPAGRPVRPLAVSGGRRGAATPRSSTSCRSSWPASRCATHGADRVLTTPARVGSRGPTVPACGVGGTGCDRRWFNRA